MASSDIREGVDFGDTVDSSLDGAIAGSSIILDASPKAAQSALGNGGYHHGRNLRRLMWVPFEIVRLDASFVFLLCTIRPLTHFSPMTARAISPLQFTTRQSTPLPSLNSSCPVSLTWVVDPNLSLLFSSSASHPPSIRLPLLPRTCNLQVALSPAEVASWVGDSERAGKLTQVKVWTLPISLKIKSVAPRGASMGSVC